MPGPTVGMSMAGPFRFSASPHQTVCSLAQPEESLTLQRQERTCSKVLLAQESQVIEPSFQAAARDTHGAQGKASVLTKWLQWEAAMVGPSAQLGN